MSIDISAQCDDCRSAMEDSERVYCAKCAKREAAECCVCRNEFPRFEMFSKTKGVMCHHCAFVYEMELFEQKKSA